MNPLLSDSYVLQIARMLRNESHLVNSNITISDEFGIFRPVLCSHEVLHTSIIFNLESGRIRDTVVTQSHLCEGV